MRGSVLLLGLVAACAGTPPRFDDRTTPAMAYRTFRGAVARGEHEREFASLSDGLRARLGVPSRVDWRDARVVLDQDHRVIRAIVRSKVAGEPVPAGDGRVIVPVEVRFLLFFRATGRVWMRPRPVLRLEFEGEERPWYWDLAGLALVQGPGGLGVQVPPEVLADLRELEADGALRSFTAREEWFLDEFAFGEETPDSVRADVESTQERSRP